MNWAMNLVVEWYGIVVEGRRCEGLAVSRIIIVAVPLTPTAISCQARPAFQVLGQEQVRQ